MFKLRFKSKILVKLKEVVLATKKNKIYIYELIGMDMYPVTPNKKH